MLINIQKILHYYIQRTYQDFIKRSFFTVPASSASLFYYPPWKTRSFCETWTVQEGESSSMKQLRLSRPRKIYVDEADPGSGWNRHRGTTKHWDGAGKLLDNGCLWMFILPSFDINSRFWPIPGSTPLWRYEIHGKINGKIGNQRVLSYGNG